jgi:hypothetical protein
VHVVDAASDWSLPFSPFTVNGAKSDADGALLTDGAEI